MTSDNGKNKQSRFGNLAFGAALIIIGGLFFLGQVLEINIWGFIWPFFIIIPGLLLFALGVSKGGAEGEGAVIPGSIITMVGLLLLYQNVFHHYQSWAYAWALIAPTSIGLGQMFYGLLKDRPDMVNTGRRLATIGIVIFLIGAVFFELIIGISGFGFARWGLKRFVFPLLLIGLGVFFLIRSVWLRNKPAPSTELSHQPVHQDDLVDGETTVEDDSDDQVFETLVEDE